MRRIRLRDHEKRKALFSKIQEGVQTGKARRVPVERERLEEEADRRAEDAAREAVRVVVRVKSVDK